ncbi:recombinase family protein [Nocardioides alkalitolerans]|uniref:recombinase family protein n=1 Tax=Nocardioides alkalitolerans TaxID=281714 RepID=UPI00040C7B9D|nr:recombinase family protein [Nocardioides alkalitolerans]
MRAATYTRISRDYAGEGHGVERQALDTQALCDTKGYEVVARYEDNDVSAAGAVKRERPSYNSMLEAAKAGEFEVIVAYSNSRLTRRPRELEDLIDLHQNHGIRFDTCVSGQDDLSTADGRMVARIKANVDAAEAERTAERITRQKAGRAAAGLKQGGRYRVLGYSRTWEVIEDEAQLVREIFSRRAAGESSSAIATDLHSRGLETTAGKPWTGATIGKILSRTEYAGILTSNGKVVGKTAFGSIVDEATFEAATALKTAAARPGMNARRHLLSGFLVCSRCMTGLKGNGLKDRPSYRCPSPVTDPTACGSTSVKMPDTDAAIFNAAWRKFQEAPVAPKADERNFDAEIAAIDKRLEDIRSMFTSGDLALEDVQPMLKAEREARSALVKEASEVVTLDAISQTFINGMVDFYGMNLSQQRLWIANKVKSVIVHPTTRGGRAGYDVRRLEVFYTDGTSERLTAPKSVDRIKVEQV